MAIPYRLPRILLGMIVGAACGYTIEALRIHVTGAGAAPNFPLAAILGAVVGFYLTCDR